MKIIKMRNVVLATLIGLVLGACSDLASEVQSDLDSDPRLTENNIKTEVIKNDNGFVTVKVTGFSEKANHYLNKGESPDKIARWYTSETRVLADAEEVIKKRPGVKAVIWKADPPTPAVEADVKVAQAGVRKVATSVDQYYLDSGSLPSTIDDLVSRPGNASNWGGPYLKESQLMDPWGNPYVIKVPGEGGQPYAVISLGSDKAVGGKDTAADIDNNQ